MSIYNSHVIRVSVDEDIWDGRVKNLIYDVDSMAWVSQTATAATGGAGDASAANQTTEIARLTSILSALQATLSVAEPAVASATQINVAAAAASTAIAAANANRKGMILTNNSTADVTMAYGASVTTALFTFKIPAGGYWEMPKPIYTGAISGIWASANGTMQGAEL